MTSDATPRPDRIDLDKEDREQFNRLATEVASRMRQLKSVQKRFGSSPFRHMDIIIQNPDDPDTVQICVEVVTPGPDGSFHIACWCEPPGTCTEGPCGGRMLV